MRGLDQTNDVMSKLPAEGSSSSFFSVPSQARVVLLGRTNFPDIRLSSSLLTIKRYDGSESCLIFKFYNGPFPKQIISRFLNIKQNVNFLYSCILKAQVRWPKAGDDMSVMCMIDQVITLCQF